MFHSLFHQPCLLSKFLFSILLHFFPSQPHGLSLIKRWEILTVSLVLFFLCICLFIWFNDPYAGTYSFTHWLTYTILSITNTSFQAYDKNKVKVPDCLLCHFRVNNIIKDEAMSMKVQQGESYCFQVVVLRVGWTSAILTEELVRKIWVESDRPFYSACACLKLKNAWDKTEGAFVGIFP